MANDSILSLFEILIDKKGELTPQMYEKLIEEQMSAGDKGSKEHSDYVEAKNVLRDRYDAVHGAGAFNKVRLASSRMWSDRAAAQAETKGGLSPGERMQQQSWSDATWDPRTWGWFPGKGTGAALGDLLGSAWGSGGERRDWGWDEVADIGLDAATIAAAPARAAKMLTFGRGGQSLASPASSWEGVKNVATSSKHIPGFFNVAGKAATTMPGKNYVQRVLAQAKAVGTTPSAKAVAGSNRVPIPKTIPAMPGAGRWVSTKTGALAKAADIGKNSGKAGDAIKKIEEPLYKAV